MATPRRRPAGRPDPAELAGLSSTPESGGRLRKAAPTDPVLGVVAPADASAQPRRRPGTRRAPVKTKVGFYAHGDDMARARAAHDWTRPRTGHRSFSDFIAHAVMTEVRRLEHSHHDGQPWPPLEPGDLPTGRPLGG